MELRCFGYEPPTGSLSGWIGRWNKSLELEFRWWNNFYRTTSAAWKQKSRQLHCNTDDWWCGRNIEIDESVGCNLEINFYSQKLDMKKYLGILFALLSVQLQASSYYNVRDFGAKGDGKTIDSPSINKAIEAAAKEVGGGTVIFPAGTYASYSVRLKSNICLQLEATSRVHPAQ